jgi:Type IV Pilus-assembly protein W
VSMTDLNGDSHYIRKGTDVIAVRGVLTADKYALTGGDVTCAGSCATTSAMTVRIQANLPSGVTNFAVGAAPSMAGRARPFYFVVSANTNEVVTTGTGTYLVPAYYVGLVDTTGAWFTQTPTTFTFVMDPSDAGARKLLATAPSATEVANPFSGGIVDEIHFFVDEGATDASTSAEDTHPSLAEAILDPASGNFEIQPLIEEVEDFQIAYGVDGIDGTPHDHGISPAVIDVSGTNRDEWVGNFANEIASTLPITSDPKRVDAFIDASVPTGESGPGEAIAALRSVMMALVVKSTDPDFVYDGPGGRGIKVLDSTATSFSTATGRPYRRRLQTFAVSLRNYQ